MDGQTNIEQLQSRIKELFKDDPDLVVGFEKFLPGMDQKDVVEGEEVAKQEGVVGEQNSADGL